MLATLLFAALLGCGRGGDAGAAPTRAGSAATSTAATSAAATSTGQSASGCGADVVINDWWPGEYPSPVIQVLAPVSLPARSDICDAEPTLSCRLSPGLIHPWVRDGDARFFSVQPVSRFELLQPTELYTDAGPVTLPVGTVVEERGYMAEGMCRLRVEGRRYEGECPGNGDQEGRYRRIGSSDGTVRQFVGVPCDGVRLGWIEVTDGLAERPELTWGQIVGYGEVGPADPAAP